MKEKENSPSFENFSDAFFVHSIVHNPKLAFCLMMKNFSCLSFWNSSQNICSLNNSELDNNEMEGSEGNKWIYVV